MNFSGRAAAESRLAAAIAKLSATQRRTLLELLGDPPSLTRLPADFWQQQDAAWTQALTPELEQIFVDAVLEQVQAFPFTGIDWGLANERAEAWARTYTFKLVTGINDTTRRGLQQAIGDYFTQPTTLGALRTQLERWYNPVRADMIATTEVTRAATQGELETVRQIGEQGLRLKPVWQTNNDELVCPICGPRHNQEIKDGQYPPAHPRCRCWTTHELRRR